MDEFQRNLIETQLMEHGEAEEQRQWQRDRDTRLVDGVGDYLETRTRLDVAGIVLDFVWAPVDADLHELGTAAGLIGMLSAAVDRDGDGTLSEAEQETFDAYLDTAAEFLLAAGVTDSDVSAILDKEDEQAVFRVRQLLIDTLPVPGSTAFDDLISEFAIHGGEGELTFDAAAKTGWSWARRHRGRVTVNSRHGKKNVVHHRTKWRKATTLQRISITKARTRAHTAMAKLLNKRSNKRTREKLGGRRVI